MHDSNRIKRVLLVDDDPLVRKSFLRCFADENFDLEVAEGAEQALAILEGGEVIDVIVADFLMPGKDGVRLLEQVKEQWPEMVRILFTASAESTRVQNSLRNGLAAALIEKPWDRDHIYSVISSF